MLALARLEHEQCLIEGMIARAIDLWVEYARDPWHPRWERPDRCGILECCPEPSELRSILKAALTVLPAKDARKLRRRLPGLDEFE